MSEEKRILILTGDKDELCDLFIDCPREVPCSKCNLGISRAEAVERMVKAMSADDIPVEGYKVLAKAALDALLK